MSHQYRLIVIGSGSGGKDAAILAARAGLSVLLVEKESLGGTCFHRGCHAIRALRACAIHYGEAQRSSRFGLSVDLSETGWADWIGTQRRVSASQWFIQAPQRRSSAVCRVVLIGLRDQLSALEASPSAKMPS